MLGKTWVSNLCEVLGVDEKELEKHKQTQKASAGVVEKLIPKKQDKTENSSAGGASSGGNTNTSKNTVTINKSPTLTTTIGTTSADDPLAAYCDDLAKQKA